VLPILLAPVLAAGLAVGLVAGCRPEPNPESKVPGGRKASSTEGEHHVPGGAKTRSKGRPGVAHSGAIDKIAVAPDGSAALTSDVTGGVRLWSALDGSREPQPLPIRAPQAMSIAADGTGWTMFVVDASGGAKIMVADAAGTIRTVAELPPFSPLFEGHVLPGGKHVLALFRDHSIRLVDLAGKDVGQFGERRFRPTSLRIAADGTRALAMVTSPESGGMTKIDLQPIAITTGPKPSVKLGGKPRQFTISTAVAPSTIALSPDGTRAAVVERWNGAQWDVAVLTIGDDKPPQRFAVVAAAHTVPGVGFVGASKVIVSANDGSVSWLVDADAKVQFPRNAPPQDFNSQLRVQATGGDRHVSAHGSWLYVSEVSKRTHRFIGYRSLQATSIAVAPGRQTVATVYPQGPVWIEPLDADSGPSYELPNDPFNGVFKLRYASADRLLLIDGMGGVRLVDWRTGESIAEAGVNGSVRSVHVDTRRGLLLIDRHSTVNDSRMFELAGDEIRGPYIVADQSYRAGLLSAGVPKNPDAVMWSLDSANRLRYYGLSELRSDLSDADVKRKAIDLKPGQVAPLALDGSGRQYGVRWNGSRMEIFVDNGEHVRSRAIGDGSVNEIIPASDGKSFVAIHQRPGGMGVTVYDSDDLKERWAVTTGTFHHEVVWAPDGDAVAIATLTGAIVRDARTGETAYQRCGLDFQVTGTPPSSALSNVNQRTVCEP
jgi:hypothetical protein